MAARRWAPSRRGGAGCPCAAARMVRHPVHRHRCANRALSTWPTAGDGPSAASRHRIPGVQNPHWLAAWAANASTSPAARSGTNPSTVVTDRPATQDGAAPALTLRAAAVLDRPDAEAFPEGVEQRARLAGHLHGAAVERE